MTNIVANGNAYSDDGSSSRDMQGGGFRQWLLPMLGDVMQQADDVVQQVSDSGIAATDAADAAALSASTASSAAIAAQEALDAIALIGNGWTPVPRIAVDGARLVLEIYDWNGGLGPKPATGFLAASGLVPNVANGLNFRGAVAYDDLTGKPTLGTAAALDVPAAPAAAATAAQVVRGDDPRLTGGSSVADSVYLTASQTWTKPPGIAWVLVELWAGGASGGAAVSTTSGNNERTGGEGGEYVQRLFRAEDLGATVYVTIGAGGAAVTATANALLPGNPGSDTTFGGHARALGGIAAASTGAAFPTGKSFLIGKTGGNGRGGGGGDVGYASVHGGGGGGGSATSVRVPGASQFGGSGGAGVLSATSPASADAGVAPGGGGGGVRISINTGTATSGPGASGAARISYW